MRYKTIIIVMIIIVMVLGVVYITYKNYQETEALVQKETQEGKDKTTQSGQAKMIGNCIVKPFAPKLNQLGMNYDYTQDMIYQDKIYHKQITSYDEYTIYKDRWNNILDMSKEDFIDKFMIITAVENTSMIGLTVKEIYIHNNTLYISLAPYEEGVDFNIDDACHSIILPKYMETENIIIQKKETEQNENQKYTFSNDSIIGLNPIAKEEAEQIWLSMASMMKVPYNPINYKNYTQITEIVAEERKPNSLFMQEDSTTEYANFNRKVWVIKTKDPNTISDFLDVYIDMYTKELVGGYIYGD